MVLAENDLYSVVIYKDHGIAGISAARDRLRSAAGGGRPAIGQGDAGRVCAG
jgi:hypothetical protein